MNWSVNLSPWKLLLVFLGTSLLINAFLGVDRLMQLFRRPQTLKKSIKILFLFPERRLSLFVVQGPLSIDGIIGEDKLMFHVNSSSIIPPPLEAIGGVIKNFGVEVEEDGYHFHFRLHFHFCGQKVTFLDFLDPGWD